jgi:hypothetical protein
MVMILTKTWYNSGFGDSLEVTIMITVFMLIRREVRSFLADNVVFFLFCRQNVSCCRRVGDMSLVMSLSQRHFMSARGTKRHDICRHVATCRQMSAIK